jgi:RNA polymerase sporulation-specific sigma factor
MLDNEETAALLARAKNGDGDARGQLVTKNSPLVKSILKRYIGKGIEYDDLYQLGCLGLIKALNKYDVQYNVKFTTYAMPLIIGEIKRFLRDDGEIKVSRSVKSLYVKIKRYLALHGSDEKQPSCEKIAQEFGVSREDVIFAMDASHLPVSLFEKGEGDSGEETLCLADKLAGSDDKDYIDKLMLKNMLKKLNDRERKVILLRYYRNSTQSEVARILSLSQVQVSRIEQKVLHDFREYFNGRQYLA